MNLSEVEEMTEWDSADLGNLTLYVALFGKNIPFVLFPELDAEPIVTDKMAAIITDVVAL